MRFTRRGLAALGTGLAVSLTLTSGASATPSAPFPAHIDLPHGWAPEGIAIGRGTTAYAGSLADGSIARIDLRTGAVEAAFVRGTPGAVAVGLEYEPGADRLWVAGGPTGEVRAYAASSGALLATYSFAAGFINDLVATHGAIVATDSSVAQLLVIPLGRGGGLPDPGAAFTLPISGDLHYQAGFNANGIVTFAGQLLVAQTNAGALFAVSPATGATLQLLPDGSISFADGLEVLGSSLFVVRNQLNRVDRYAIHGARVMFQGSTSSADLDVPTAVGFAAGRLWAVNARFNTPPTPATPYWLTSLSTP
jgi:outer membrane protein assembly factor BamB